VLEVSVVAAVTTSVAALIAVVGAASFARGAVGSTAGAGRSAEVIIGVVAAIATDAVVPSVVASARLRPSLARGRRQVDPTGRSLIATSRCRHQW